VSVNSLFIFIDESGDLQKGNTGSNYFVITGVTTFSPELSAEKVQSLRYALISQGWKLPHFHASDNLRIIRREFGMLINSLNSIGAFTVIFDKAKQAKNDYKPSDIFSMCMIQIFDLIINKYKNQFRRLIIVADQTLTKSERGRVFGVVREYLKSRDISFFFFFERALSEPNMQISDYLSWSIFQVCEKGKESGLDVMKIENRLEVVYFKNDHPG
jgi:hypothetical protein